MIANFIDQDAATLKKYWIQLAKILPSLSQRIIKEAGADGIYLSVQSIQDARVTQEVYKKLLPSELHVLEPANEAGGVNILHICGYEGSSQ